jgi:hypothetical protein
MKKIIGLFLIIFFILACFTTVYADLSQEKIKYVGIWKLEKIMAPYGKNWEKPKYPLTLKIFPNGRLKYYGYKLIITGTYRILDDKHIQINEENIDGKSIQPASISVFTLQNEKLTKPAKPYINENEKAEIGSVFKKLKDK